MEITDNFSDYEEAVNFVFDIPKFTKKNTLEATRKFYDFLGCPAEKIKTVHVAGTNGKGSTCNYLSDILRTHGYSVGFFSSPHLVSVCERFRINDRLMEEEDFVQNLNLVMHKVKEYSESGNEYYPTFFEVLFLMGMEWFEQKKPDIIILETGLGGLLDATNLVKEPALTIITRIGLDHTEYLGNTLEEIAGQKAGIIKRKVPLVYWDTCKSVSDVFEKEAKEKDCMTFPVGRSNIGRVSIKEKSIDFYLTFGYDNSGNRKEINVLIPTVALYQTENVALAFNAAYILLGTSMNEKDSSECLWHSFWTGRMEEIQPGFFVDGAHNPNGTEAFIETLKQMQKEENILLFAANKDKDYVPTIKMLSDCGFFNGCIVTRLKGTRSEESLKLKEEFKRAGLKDVIATSNVSEAVKEALNTGKRVFAIGSLYLVGEIMEELQ